MIDDETCNTIVQCRYQMIIKKNIYTGVKYQQQTTTNSKSSKIKKKQQLFL